MKSLELKCSKNVLSSFFANAACNSLLPNNNKNVTRIIIYSSHWFLSSKRTGWFSDCGETRDSHISRVFRFEWLPAAVTGASQDNLSVAKTIYILGPIILLHTRLIATAKYALFILYWILLAIIRVRYSLVSNKHVE